MQPQNSAKVPPRQEISPGDDEDFVSPGPGIRRFWNATICARLSPCESAVFTWVFDGSILGPRLAGSRKIRPVAIPIREIARRFSFDPGAISKAVARLTSRQIVQETTGGYRINPRLDDWQGVPETCLAWLQTPSATLLVPHADHDDDRFKNGITPPQQGCWRPATLDTSSVGAWQQGCWRPATLDTSSVGARQQAQDLRNDVRARASEDIRDNSSIFVSPPQSSSGEYIPRVCVPETSAPTLAGAREAEVDTHTHTQTNIFGCSIPGDETPDATVLAKVYALAHRYVRDDVVNVIDQYKHTYPSTWFLILSKRILALYPRKFKGSYLISCLRDARRDGDPGIGAEADYDDEMRLLPRDQVKGPEKRPELRANASAYLPAQPAPGLRYGDTPFTGFANIAPPPGPNPQTGGLAPRRAAVGSDLMEAEFIRLRDQQINALKNRSQNK